MVSFKNYLSLVKFSHTIFALPFALFGFFLGTFDKIAPIDWSIFLLVLLDMVWARNAAMAFNRYLDRHIDSQNERTIIRDIPSGKITPVAAFIFVLFNVLAFLATTYFINRLTFYLAPVALLVILGYSYTKRYTALCHLVLGLGLSLAPIGAYLAVVGEFDWVPVLLSFAVLFWVSGFDIIYALQDENFDKQMKLKSIPVLIGAKGALVLSKILHLFSVLFLISVGIQGEFSWIYWIGFGVFSSLLFYQHTIVKFNDLSKVNLAFFTTNGVASVLFGLLSILDLLVRMYCMN